MGFIIGARVRALQGKAAAAAAVLGLVAASAGVVVSTAGMAAAGNDKPTICHATGSDTNPSVSISPSDKAQGHQKHEGDDCETVTVPETPTASGPQGPKDGKGDPKVTDEKPPKTNDPQGPKVKDPKPPKTNDPQGPKVNDPQGPKVKDPKPPKVNDPQGPKVKDPKAPTVPKGPKDKGPDDNACKKSNAKPKHCAPKPVINDPEDNGSGGSGTPGAGNGSVPGSPPGTGKDNPGADKPVTSKPGKGAKPGNGSKPGKGGKHPSAHTGGKHPSTGSPSVLGTEKSSTTKDGARPTTGPRAGRPVAVVAPASAQVAPRAAVPTVVNAGLGSAPELIGTGNWDASAALGGRLLGGGLLLLLGAAALSRGSRLSRASAS